MTISGLARGAGLFVSESSQLQGLELDPTAPAPGDPGQAFAPCAVPVRHWEAPGCLLHKLTRGPKANVEFVHVNPDRSVPITAFLPPLETLADEMLLH